MAGNRESSGSAADPETIVQLSGTDFLTIKCHCSQCDWHGEVGDMRLSAFKESEGTMFSCPECGCNLARYDGPLPDEIWEP